MFSFLAMFFNLSFMIIFLIVFYIGTIVLSVYLLRLSFKRKLNGQIIIRKQKHRISFNSILLVAFFIVFGLIEKGNPQTLFIGFLLSVFPVIEYIEDVMYRREKPASLAIDGDKLYFNQIWLIKRNIENLRKISLNDFSNNINLYFKSETSLSFNKNNYQQDELKDFVKYLIENSSDELTVNEGLKKFVN